MSKLYPSIDPEGLVEYSVVHTDRSLNHMSQSFQALMKNISKILKQVYNAQAVAVVPGSGTFGMEAVAVQFVLDHLARPLADGSWAHLLPPAIDATLVAARIKAKPGALTFNTVSHRLAVLGKWHRLNEWDSPTEASALKTLLREARKAQSRQGISVRKKTAMVLEPLQTLLATCSDGVRGVRGRPCSCWPGAVAGDGARKWSVCKWVMCANRMPTPSCMPWVRPRPTVVVCVGRSRYEVQRRRHSLPGWTQHPAESAPLFWRMYKGGKVGTAGLSADQVARIVQRRAKLAGLDGDWAAHNLRSEFVTEAGRQGVPLGEVMAMTERRSVSTVMGYFQAGSLLNSLAANLLTQDSQEDSDT